MYFFKVPETRDGFTFWVTVLGHVTGTVR